MTRNSFVSKLVIFLLACQATVAFVPGPARVSRPAALVLSEATKHSEHATTTTNVADGPTNKLTKFLTTAAITIYTSPLVALAEEADDYEYGAVDAPIGLAWAAGCLAILTALLPIALQGGEEAFEEMKDRDSGKWGKND